MKGFARCEYFDCGHAAAVGIKIDGITSEHEEVSIVIHYCPEHFEKVETHDECSDAIFSELLSQGCSEKMANHVMLARLERERFKP